jgi:hypothetical protein
MYNNQPAGQYPQETGRRGRRLSERRGNPVTSVILALCFIWGAVVLLWEMTQSEGQGDVNRGAVFLLGLGVIVTGGGIFRLLKGNSSRGMIFSFLLGFVLIVAGIGQWVNIQDNLIAVFILLVVAVALLINAFTPRKPENP